MRHRKCSETQLCNFTATCSCCCCCRIQMNSKTAETIMEDMQGHSLLCSVTQNLPCQNPSECSLNTFGETSNHRQANTFFQKQADLVSSLPGWTGRSNDPWYALEDIGSLTVNYFIATRYFSCFVEEKTNISDLHLNLISTKDLPHSLVIHGHLEGQQCQVDPGRNTSAVTAGTVQYILPFGVKRCIT